MPAFTESVVEDAALAWLESLSYAIKHGLEIPPGEPAAERQDYGRWCWKTVYATRRCPSLSPGELRVKDAEKPVEGAL